MPDSRTRDLSDLYTRLGEDQVHRAVRSMRSSSGWSEPAGALVFILLVAVVAGCVWLYYWCQAIEEKKKSDELAQIRLEMTEAVNTDDLRGRLARTSLEPKQIESYVEQYERVRKEKAKKAAEDDQERIITALRTSFPSPVSPVEPLGHWMPSTDPYSAIVRIRASREGVVGTVIGTGILIGANKVLTSGELLANHEVLGRGRVTHVRVELLAEPKTRFDITQKDSIRVSKKWLEHRDSAHNWGLLLLPNQVTGVQPVKLGAFTDEFLRYKQVSMPRYELLPSSVPNTETQAFNLYFATILNASDNVINLHPQQAPDEGLPGTPVLVEYEDGYRVAAIQGSSNTAKPVRMTAGVIETVNKTN